VVQAVQEQVATLIHVPNTWYTEVQGRWAKLLSERSFGGQAFFCNSGAEANEALIKLARRYQREVKGQKERFEFITFEGGFHGRTLATVTATAQPKYHAGFEPLPAGFKYAKMGDLEGVKALLGPQTAAILVEPIQGEGGVRPAPAGFLKALRELCTAQGVLLLIDEVQTGIGRTGKPFAFQHDGITPDAFSLAKSLGNGLPIGAMVCSDEVGKALPPATHGSTFGGNLVACAAAIATWDIATAPETMKETEAKGEYARELALAIKARKPGRVTDVRGRGLLFGVEVDQGAADVLARCRAHGLLVNLAGERTLRFAPSYLVSREQLAEGLAILEASL
jgi:acetylornithine/N-succinyldiaminopimelate aminotransferase